MKTEANRTKYITVGNHQFGEISANLNDNYKLHLPEHPEIMPRSRSKNVPQKRAKIFCFRTHPKSSHAGISSSLGQSPFVALLK